MRKANREVKDLAELTAILEKCDACRIGLALHDVPYVVPMNFGYTLDGERLTLYLHCAGEGRKLDIIAQNPNVCFEMDCSHTLIVGEAPCNYTMEFESIIGSGRISVLTETEEKIRGLTQVMRKYSAENEFSFPEKVVNVVTVLRLDADEFTGKRLKR